MRDLVRDLEILQRIRRIARSLKPRYVLLDGDWYCVQMDYSKAAAIVHPKGPPPRVWPTSKPEPALRLVAVDGVRHD